VHILLSNDDGVDAQGLLHLRDALVAVRPRWRISVVAPDREQSGTSHALTLSDPLRVEQRGEAIWSVSGTPTDCVLLAMNMLFEDDRPDLVISGINHGPNLGEDVHYSGTVAAAFEGRILGVPAVALSLASREIPLDFGQAVQFARELLPTWIERGLPNGTLLNVNIPAGGPASARGIRSCRLGSRQYNDVVVRKEDPRGRAYYWIGGTVQSIDPGPDTDLVLSAEGWITVTPLRVDLTDAEALAGLRAFEATW
jgi:5'-nucleotidase